MDSTRREILRNGWKLGGTLLAAAAGWTTYESLRPLASAAAAPTINLGDPATYKPDTATYISDGRLFVANTGSRLFALSQKCPHLGCRVPFCDSSGRFECPCHGSKYNLGGEWIEGPAPRGMDRYQLTLEGGTLVADTSKLISGPQRGANRFFRPAKGPSCAPKA
jgi:nitrite reductase/ring-hydroxylating ferredoxin subunit